MSAGDWKKMLEGIQKNDIELVKYYIESGINPNYQHPEFQTTPLIEGIELRRYEIIKYLLEKGADPLLKVGFSNDSPMKIAKKNKDRKIIQLLESYSPQKTSFWKVWIKKRRHKR